MKSRKNKPEINPSLEYEPHLDKDFFERDISERNASLNLSDDRQRETLDDLVDRSVWDEPAIGGMTVADEESDSDPLTYAKWLDYRWKNTSDAFSWMITAIIILIAGPLAVLTAIFNPSVADTWSQVLMVTVFGPISEELAKICLVLWAIEKRPFWFRSGFQIVFCAMAGGFVFAAIENVLYLREDLFNWENSLTIWRWTVCVFLHTGCCFISSLGMIRVWQTTLETKKRPELEICTVYVGTAIVIHGVYNGFAVFISKVGFLF